MYKFILPFRAPSVNTYWRKWNNRMVISKAGREFKKKASNIFSKEFLEDNPYDCILKVKIELRFKDERRRDIDNYNKALLDSMSGIVFKDDCLIQEMNLKKYSGCEKDEIIIEIEELV